MLNHVKSTVDENKAWCGATLGTEFYFKDTEHAVINGITNGKPIPCNDCIKNIIHYLTKTVDDMVNN